MANRKTKSSVSGKLNVPNGPDFNYGHLYVNDQGSIGVFSSEIDGFFILHPSSCIGDVVEEGDTEYIWQPLEDGVMLTLSNEPEPIEAAPQRATRK